MGTFEKKFRLPSRKANIGQISANLERKNLAKVFQANVLE